MKPRLEDLTLREKIGQTCVFRFDELEKVDDFEEFFKNNPVGATWVFMNREKLYSRIEEYVGNSNDQNYVDDKHKDYLNMVNKYQKIPIMSVIDAGQGVTSGFNGHEGLPSAIGLGATKDKELAFQYGKALGEDLRLTGVRWLWSPVADNAGVFKDPRHLSADIENNCELLTAFIKGVQSAGVAACAKHFPGADPYEYRDSHFCLNSYSQSFEYWEKTQGREFQACIDAGVDSIMIGHKAFRAVDDTMVDGIVLPSTLSYKIITGLIKEKMGFKGVTLTDDVYMKGMSAIYGVEASYVKALQAGVDMVLGPVGLDYIDIVEKAVLDGELSEERINDACQRVLDMKDRYGMFEAEPYTYPTEEQREIARKNINEVSRKVAEKGLTLVANHTNIVPINPDKIKKVKMVYIGYSDKCYNNLKYAVEEFEKHGAVCDLQRDFAKEDNETLKDYDLIIYATFIGFHQPEGGMHFYGKECRVIRNIMIEGIEKSIGVSFGCPNIYFEYFTSAKSFVNCYSINKETMIGFVKGLYGEVQFNDYNPFPLNPITRTDDVNM